MMWRSTASRIRLRWVVLIWGGMEVRNAWDKGERGLGRSGVGGCWRVKWRREARMLSGGAEVGRVWREGFEWRVVRSVVIDVGYRLDFGRRGHVSRRCESGAKM